MFQSLYFIDIPLFILTSGTAIAYIILLSNIMDGWDETEEWEIPQNYFPKTKISVVVAARNEEDFIGQCIESILQCNYPKELLEIIIVNDHSEDKTTEVINSFKSQDVTLINLQDTFGKKNALQKGISQANGEIIACTDADCIVPKDWLISFASYFEEYQHHCVAGLISYKHNKSVLQRFQYLDSINNMCVTANGIKRKSYFMANGANFFFKKSIFFEIGGYQTNKEFASGDDMFLIQKIAERYPNKISFLKSKNAIVQTKPEITFKDLIKQRIRWSSKSKAYSNKNIYKIQGFVFFFVLLILLNFIFSPIGSGLSLFGFIFALFIKWTLDFLYLLKLSDYFGDRTPLKSFFSTSMVFILYILFAGWNALIPTTYKWKGRETK